MERRDYMVREKNMTENMVLTTTFSYKLIFVQTVRKKQAHHYTNSK